MAPLQLTPEAEARKIAEWVHQASQDEILRIARLGVSKPDHQLLSATEKALHPDGWSHGWNPDGPRIRTVRSGSVVRPGSIRGSISSGAVESACKTVVGQRLKGCGRRWGADGADAVCHLRALFRSEPGQWDAFWRRSIN